MSDTPQGDGWWQASDGKWYPPHQAPGAPRQPAGDQPTTQQPTPQQPAQPQPAQPQQPTAQQPQQPPGAVPPPYTGPGVGAGPTGAAGAVGEQAEGQGDGKGGRGRIVAIVAIVLLLIGGGIAAFLVFGGDDGDSDSASSEGDGGADSGERDIGSATGERVDDGPIEFDTTYEDALEETRTEARYTLDAPAGAIMTLTVENEEDSQRGVFATFEADGQRYAAFRTAPGSSESETVILDDQGATEFELVFTEGPAAFKFEVALETQDDAGGGGDAGSDFDSAFAIDSGQSVSARLGGDDSTDHYTLEIQPGTEFTFEASTERSSERGAFFTVEFEGDRLFAERVNPGSDTSVSLLLSDTDEGTLEIIVTEGPAVYSFTAGFDELTEGGSTGDAPGELASARSVDASAAVEGKVGGRDEADYYVFTAPAASVTVTATADPGNERGVAVTLEDESGSRLAFFRAQPGSEASETVEVAAGSEVRMIVGEGPGSYSITIG